jgi:hypothetical protein
LGYTTEPPGRDWLVAGHTFTEAIPPRGDENARINLWLHEGRPPTDASEVEVVIRRFDFNP